jgi:hypothetical protein
MKLKKMMQNRRKDAARMGIKIGKWFPTYGSLTDQDGHYRVTVSANSDDKSQLVMFNAWVDFDDNVYSSTGIVIIEL